MVNPGFLSRVNYSIDGTDEGFNTFYIYFEVAMFFTTFLFIPSVIYLFHLMWNHSQFHINLVILVSNLFISYGVLTVGRQIIFIEVYMCSDKQGCYISEFFMLRHAVYAENIKYTALVAYVIASNWIIFERIWAILHLKGYEDRKDFKLIIGVIILQWIASGGGYALALVGYLPLMVFLVPACFLTVVIVVIFKYMANFNIRRYKLCKSVGNAYTLTERYQLAENVKTSPLVLSMIYVNAIMNTSLFITVMVQFYLEEVYYKQIVKLIFDFLLTIYAPIISFAIIFSIKSWRTLFLGKWYKRKVSPQKRDTKDTVTIVNTYVVSPKTEADIYFQQLQAHWA